MPSSVYGAERTTQARWSPALEAFCPAMIEAYCQGSENKEVSLIEERQWHYQ
jgi:hypothetical protein